MAEDHDVRLVDMRKMKIIDDMVSSNFLDARSRTPYVRYIRVGKNITEIIDVLPLLKNLCKDSAAARTLGITHLDDLSIYISSEENIVLMI